MTIVEIIINAILILFILSAIPSVVLMLLDPETRKEMIQYALRPKRRRRKSRRYNSDPPILGTPWHRNKVRRELREKREKEWFRRNFGV